MLSVKTLSKDLEAIKIAHKGGASLKKLKSDVERLYEKINMKGGSKKRANKSHTRNNKTIINHNTTDDNEFYQRTQELYMMFDEVIKAFGSIPETKKYIEKIKMVNNKNTELNGVETKYILDKITEAYLDNSGELFGFNRISFLKTKTPTKQKYYKWDLEYRPEKLIPFSIAYGATKILENKDKLDDTNKNLCLKMLLNSLAPKVSKKTQSKKDGSRINRPATKSLYNKDGKFPGKFTFKLYEQRGGKPIHSLTIDTSVLGNNVSWGNYETMSNKNKKKSKNSHSKT